MMFTKLPLLHTARRGSAIRARHSLAWMTLLLLVHALFIRVAIAQPDPVKNFCRRFGHQAAVIDRKLYIDGGLLNYSPTSQYPSNYSNNGLLYHDLDVIAPAGMPQLFANLTKNNTIPSVHGGTLWSDNVNKRLYLFGGETYQSPPSPYFTLWSYDVLYNRWDSLDAPRFVNSVSYGAGVSISERGEAYYYGGWMSNNSVPGWTGPPAAVAGLIKYNMDTKSWSNGTGPDLIRRAEGAMSFLPIGDGGMLVYFGGVQDLYSNGTIVGQPMDQIFLYDVLSSKWYSQKATGKLPKMRSRFCAGATWAPDQSSYNIYLYGGAGMPPDTSGFDDVYILTIPTFQWIKLYPDKSNETGEYPHHSLTCNVIDKGQMMIIGGTFPLTDNCDAPDQFGSHNLDMGLQNPNASPWMLYRPNLTSYVVPAPIVSAIGGNAGGGATKTSPTDGFSHPDLRVLMTRKASIAERTPTRALATSTSASDGSSTSSKTLSAGAIAGIAVGGGVALLALITAILLLIRRRRKRQTTKPPISSPADSKQPTTHSGAHLSTWASPPPPTSSPTAYPPPNPFQPPTELAGSSIWRSPDGHTYELITPDTNSTTNNNHSPTSSPLHHAPSGSWSPGSTTATATNTHTNTGSGELQTKVDAEGRVWVQVPIPFTHLPPGSTSPGMGGVGRPAYSPVTPMSSYDVTPVPVSLAPVEVEGTKAEPQELPVGGGKGEGPNWDVCSGGDGGGLEGGMAGRHETYYHP